MSVVGSVAPKLRAPSWAQVIKQASPLAIAAWVAVILGLGLRQFALPEMPFWLDESWTGGIISQDSLAGVLHQSLLDTNAPLYFVLMHGWSQLFGLSNGALRFPSLIFSALAPLLVLIPTKAIPPPVRHVWCVVIALWVPAIWYAQEARCYTMLLFLATACTVAYAHLVAEPTLRRTALWALLGMLCILTHYHALILLGLQGLAYLALHRGRAVRTWPGVLIFIPALAWTALHLPRVVEYADPQIAWYPRLEAGDLHWVIIFMAGCTEAVIGLASLAVVCLALAVVRMRHPHKVPERAEAEGSSANWIVVATGALGALLVIAAAMVSTSFTNRYLIPFMPGLMLGLALGAVRLGRTWTTIPMTVVLIFAVSAPVWAARQNNEKIYNFQIASEALMAADVRHLVFLFDNSMGTICEPEQLNALGGFFFRRAGRPVVVQPMTIRSGEDPNQRLLAAANTSQPSGILWVYDLALRGTAARSYPPAIAERDPAWQCGQFGRGQMGVLACHRRSAPAGR